MVDYNLLYTSIKQYLSSSSEIFTVDDALEIIQKSGLMDVVTTPDNKLLVHNNTYYFI